MCLVPRSNGKIKLTTITYRKRKGSGWGKQDMATPSQNGCTSLHWRSCQQLTWVDGRGRVAFGEPPGPNLYQSTLIPQTLLCTTGVAGLNQIHTQTARWFQMREQQRKVQCAQETAKGAGALFFLETGSQAVPPILAIGSCWWPWTSDPPVSFSGITGMQQRCLMSGLRGARNGTQGLRHAKQTLYQLGPSSTTTTLLGISLN